MLTCSRSLSLSMEGKHSFLAKWETKSLIGHSYSIKHQTCQWNYIGFQRKSISFPLKLASFLYPSIQSSRLHFRIVTEYWKWKREHWWNLVDSTFPVRLAYILVFLATSLPWYPTLSIPLLHHSVPFLLSSCVQGWLHGYAICAVSLGHTVG